MCGSSAKRWIIGLLLLTAAVVLAVGYMMSKKPAERADKGTLVRKAEQAAMVCEEKIKGAVRAAGDCL